MEVSGAGKSPNTLSFRYNANNEALEELFHICEDDPPTPHCDASPSAQSENASPKKIDKSSSLLDKYFKSIRTDKSAEKPVEKVEDSKPVDSKVSDEVRNITTPKEVTSSPMKEYLNRLGKRSSTASDAGSDVKDGSNETWKIFHDFKFKIAQAVEDIKTRSLEETKEKSLQRDNSTSDSEENSAIKDDQQSVGDTDNQVSSLDSSMQNLSELTQPITAKATERQSSLPIDNKNNSESSDDTHKNLVRSDSADGARDLLDDNSMMDVESGIEALEDSNIDCFGGAAHLGTDCPDTRTPVDIFTAKLPPTPTNFGYPPSKTNIKLQSPLKQKTSFFNFLMYFLTFVLFINYILFPNSSIWNGFLLGIWFFYFIGNLKQWLLDNYFSDWEPSTNSFLQLKHTDTLPIPYTIPTIKEYTPLKKYEGWINHYRYPDYDPLTYHIGKTTTAFMKLEGCNLRISYTATKISKKALWDEKIEKVTFYQHRLYNLTNARVILLPKGLVRRRQWSKKYPICIILNEKEKIQVLEKENTSMDKKNTELSDKKKEPASQLDVESSETNTSPEKKKKFVWRRREKSIPNEGETGKEGLRHRFARKMHRDKKTDNVSTCTEPESQTDKYVQDDLTFHEAEMEFTKTPYKDDAEEDLDENELSKIKEFLEETELETGTTEGEWSVHVRHSVDKHSHLYLFTRTGRDKHEWYRRLNIAITEANTVSADSSSAEDKTASEPAPETKDGIEMALYKNKESISEGASPTLPSHPLPPDLDSYEKNFWPYLFKIIEPKSPQTNCECATLPGSVQWVNTTLARLMFDVMRDQKILAKVQNRIQRKLHTLKLPSFMSPLTVTQLSLAGACPVVCRVLPPAADTSGVWLDADLRYDGGAYITILTQINLMKLKEKNLTLEDQILAAEDNNLDNETNAPITGSIFLDKSHKKRKPAAYDSDVEDSAESSSDDESPPLQPVDSNENVQVPERTASVDQGGSSKKKFLRMVDKIATNKYFQQVTDYKYVKRAMEGLSNTDIKLQLEVHGLEGRLAINMPPPPHDRIWIGFRTNPQLVLKARPAVGARTLRFTHITNWIEQKLTKEFEKVLVLPNMEDIIVDLMTPTPIQYY